MTRWLIVSAVYAILFLFSSKFDAVQAIGGGLLVGAVSIGALKLFGMDRNKAVSGKETPNPSINTDASVKAACADYVKR